MRKQPNIYSDLRMELEIEIECWFDNNPSVSEIILDAETIRRRWIGNDIRTSRKHIHKVTMEEMGIDRLPYNPYSITGLETTKSCSPYRFYRDDYVDEGGQPQQPQTYN